MQAEGCAGREDSRLAGTASMVCVPLRHGARPIGVLKVGSQAPGAFTRRDAATLSQLAGFVSTTITATRDLGRSAEDLIASVPTVDPALADVEGISSFVAHVIDPGAAVGAEVAERVRLVLEHELLGTLLQPIVELSTMKLAGAEALARVQIEPATPVKRLFADARRSGLGPELQLLAARGALRAAASLPPDAFVAVNLDVDGLSRPELMPLLAEAPRPVVIELTEEVRVDDYRALRRVLSSLRRDGVRLAIDDTGAGYASLSHVVKLAPELIKLDIELVCGIDVDPVRRSLVGAVVTFAAETGSEVVAEGIETRAELDTVRDLGVHYGQGYLLGRPAAPELLALELAGVPSALD
jgi:EAL domain-containing protein (putative c-di-GMP-specific phosphodiesterase class I)